MTLGQFIRRSWDGTPRRGKSAKYLGKAIIRTAEFEDGNPRNPGTAGHHAWELGVSGLTVEEYGVTFEEARQRMPELFQKTASEGFKHLNWDAAHDPPYVRLVPYDHPKVHAARTRNGLPLLNGLPPSGYELAQDHLIERLARLSGHPSARRLGKPYRKANEAVSVASIKLFTKDPSQVERGLRGHAQTQNDLARFLKDRDIKPLSPMAGGPDYDLAWQIGDTVWVAEVKSTTQVNEEQQMRLGLGQVLRYRHALRGLGPVQAVLVPERPPTDPAWKEICSELGVILTWPGNFDNLLA